MESFFDALKRIRKNQGKTQKQMHEFLQISDTMYQNYEKSVLPPHEVIIKISRYLKHDFSQYIYQDILGLDKEGRYDPLLKELQEIVQKYQSSSDDPKKAGLRSLRNPGANRPAEIAPFGGKLKAPDQDGNTSNIHAKGKPGKESGKKNH